jgi:hypothetical protein
MIPPEMIVESILTAFGIPLSARNFTRLPRLHEFGRMGIGFDWGKMPIGSLEG